MFVVAIRYPPVPIKATAGAAYSGARRFTLFRSVLSLSINCDHQRATRSVACGYTYIFLPSAVPASLRYAGQAAVGGNGSCRLSVVSYQLRFTRPPTTDT
jgi:hypothetical protein